MAGIYDEEILGAREQAETARKLREAGVNTPQGQMVSGWYVRPSITQYLAEGLKGYGNVQREKEATAKYEGLRKEKASKIAELLKQFPAAKESYPSAQIGADGPTIAAKGVPVVTQPEGQDYMKWAIDMSQYSPETATLGSKLAEYDMTRKDKKEMAQERADARKDEMSLRADLARQAAQDRKDNIRLMASLRPPAQEPLVAVMGKDGAPIMLPRSQAVGMTPFNAQTSKAGNEKYTEDEKKSAGYVVRMQTGLNMIKKIAEENPKATTANPLVNMVGGVSETAKNYLQSEDRQRIEAAQSDALDAALTLATGAAYTKEQLAGLRQSYFAQPGDSPQTVADKEARLQDVIKTAELRAGRASKLAEEALGQSGQEGTKPKPLFNPRAMPTMPQKGGARFLGFE